MDPLRLKLAPGLCAQQRPQLRDLYPLPLPFLSNMMTPICIYSGSSPAMRSQVRSICEQTEQPYLCFASFPDFSRVNLNCDQVLSQKNRLCFFCNNIPTLPAYIIIFPPLSQTM